MWSPLFFTYNLLSLIISSIASLKLRGLSGVDRISYINNIALLITVAIMSFVVGVYSSRALTCSGVRDVNFDFYSGVIISVLGLFIEAIYIAIIANAQFQNCTKEVKNLFITALVLNSIGLAVGFSYVVHDYSKH